MELSNKLTVIDENNKEIEMEILYTFDYEGKSYVLYFDPSIDSEDMEVYASVYDESGNLFDVETEEEWAIIEETLEHFTNDDEEEESNDKQ